MAQVHVEIDEGWKWWVTPPLPGEKTIELPEAILQRLAEVTAEYSRLQEYLEHAYRHQEGLHPFVGSPFVERQG
jgi:hypothetical protein